MPVAQRGIARSGDRLEMALPCGEQAVGASPALQGFASVLELKARTSIFALPHRSYLEENTPNAMTDRPSAPRPPRRGTLENRPVECDDQSYSRQQSVARHEHGTTLS
jgi:hypothetical protein